MQISVLSHILYQILILKLKFLKIYDSQIYPGYKKSC